LADKLKLPCVLRKGFKGKDVYAWCEMKIGNQDVIVDFDKKIANLPWYPKNSDLALFFSDIYAKPLYDSGDEGVSED